MSTLGAVQTREPEQVCQKTRPSLLKSGAHTVSTNVLQVLGVLATTAIISRSLGPERKGTYDLYLATSALISTVLGFSLSSGITYVVASSAVNLRRLASTLLAFAALQGLVAWVFVSLLNNFAFRRFVVPVQIGSWVATLIALTVFSTALSGTLRSVLAGQRWFIAANHIDLAKQIFAILFALGALTFAWKMHSSKVNALVVANILAIAAAALLFLKAIRAPIGSSAVDSGFWKACAFSLPCYASTIVQFLNYRLDVFFVNSIAGTKELGLYQLAVLLCQGINLVPGSAQAVLFPTISAMVGSHAESGEIVARANRLLTLFAVGCASLLGVAGIWGIPLLFGEAFRGAIPALLLLIPGCVVFVTTNVIAGYFAGTGRPRLNLYASLAGVALTIPLDFLLIPRWGISGAAVASTISYTTTSIVTLTIFCRSTGIPVQQTIFPKLADFTLLRQALSGLRPRS